MSSRVFIINRESNLIKFINFHVIECVFAND